MMSTARRRLAAQPAWGSFAPDLVGFTLALCTLALWSLATPRLWGDERSVDRQVLSDRPHHLRKAGVAEWADFPESPESDRLEIRFSVTEPARWQTLRLVQQDVKQSWKVRLNETELGLLPTDENDQVVLFTLPPESLRAGENLLSVSPAAESSPVDDIRVGPLELVSPTRDELVHEATLQVRILDANSGRPIPGRLTVTDDAGVLQPVAPQPGERLAVRTGVVYTGTGEFSIGVPAGTWRVWAGRGFEYSVDSQRVTVTAGEARSLEFRLTREVPTPGLVACDTHIHTLTHSGHGDATVEERMLTIAGEGIELPIATDHNSQIDQEPFARQAGVRQYFTPVVGNEVTTPHGHFNIFPAQAGGIVPEHRTTDWTALFDNIQGNPRVRVIILNHARDLHSGVRPFGPRFRNAAVGRLLDGRVLRANAMEVINSGAVQTDPLQLVHDWMVQLNAGQALSPVGASDSHDVSRFLVGQGRTYLKASDDDPGEIPVAEAVASLTAGRVWVSYGLLVDLEVGGRFGPGDVVPSRDGEVDCRLRVLGPGWANVHTVRLYGNGELLREQTLPADHTRPAGRPGVIWEETWRLPPPRHDVHLVAVAMGPGVDAPFWKTARPYQPTSPRFEPSTLGVSGAVWLDVDGNGRGTPAVELAGKAWGEAGGDLARLIGTLEGYDAAVAAQAAWLCTEAGHDLDSREARGMWQSAGGGVSRGFERFLEAHRLNQEEQSRAGRVTPGG